MKKTALLLLLLLLTAPCPAAVIPWDTCWGKAAALPVSFTEPTPPALRARIVRHMNEWSRHGAVVFYDAPVGIVRVTRNPSEGFWSYIGKEHLWYGAWGGPTMGLPVATVAEADANAAGIVHEAGHALGLRHEHTRPEIQRDLYPGRVVALYRQIYGWDAATTVEWVLTTESLARTWYTPPDPDSIMCYGLPASVTRSGRAYGTGSGISFWDGRLIGAVYSR